jgi:HK97 family phage major capsid protein
MSDFIKSQAEVRANLIGQMREVIDAAEAEKRGLSAEDNQKIERIEADIEARDAAISTAQKVAEREARAIEAASEFTPVATADSNENDVIRALASGAKRSHEFARESRAALVPGANTVGTSFYDQVFQVAALVGPMLTTSEVFRTNSGENLVIPTVTALSTSASTSAGSAISESNPTFSSITLGATKYAALVSVSNELLADAGFDISTYIATQLGTSLGIATNTALTTSLNSAAGSVVTGGTGVAGVATYENIVDLVYGIAAGARVLPGLGFMASRTGIAGMRKLKDTAGTYIWNDMKTAIDGQPASLLGYPVYENPDVAATGVGNKSILFGHLPSFKVRVAGGIQVAQSSDYAFNTDVTTFRGIIRVDGGLTHATHIGYFKGGAS